MLTHKELAIKVTLPVFSFISHKTLKRAGFILWQLSACFLKKTKKTKTKEGWGDRTPLSKSVFKQVATQLNLLKSLKGYIFSTYLS